MLILLLRTKVPVDESSWEWRLQSTKVPENESSTYGAFIHVSFSGTKVPWIWWHYW